MEKNATQKVEVPARVKVISQSCSADVLIITVIDLSNNEIVILSFQCKYGVIGAKPGNLLNVSRTGMFVDPNSQGFINGTDASIDQSRD